MKYTFLIPYILLLLSIFSCSESKKENFNIEGKTMGTYYLVKIVSSPKGLTLKKIKKEIEITLININQQLSNWDKFSEISVLNKNKSHLAFVFLVSFLQIRSHLKLKILHILLQSFRGFAPRLLPILLVLSVRIQN